MDLIIHNMIKVKFYKMYFININKSVNTRFITFLNKKTFGDIFI